MDPLRIDVGAEIIDLVKRLGAPRAPRRIERLAERPVERSRPTCRPDEPDPPEAA